jgi:putative DNA primase/helicase
MIDAAMSYVKRGWLVLPLHTRVANKCSCQIGHSLRACSSPAKHPRVLHGVKDASKCPCAVTKWWEMWPDSNIAIACGRESNLVVIDIDPRNDGVETMLKLLQGDGLPETTTAYTGGGGLHYYFQYPLDGIPKQVLGDGVDLVSNGGYVVAPPSKHMSGDNYAWVPGRDPWSTPPVRLPEWLMTLGAKNTRSSSAFSLNTDEPVRKGARNITFIRIAGAMRRWGMGYEAIDAALQIHNEVSCDPPMSIQEVQRIARNAMNYAPEDPNGETEQDEGGELRVAHRPVVD